MALAFTVGTAVNATVTITNATGATVTNLPAGVTSSGAASGANFVVTFSGTPTTASTGHINIVATNSCGATPATANTTGNTAFDWTVNAGVAPPPATGGTLKADPDLNGLGSVFNITDGTARIYLGYRSDGTWIATTITVGVETTLNTGTWADTPVDAAGGYEYRVVSNDGGVNAGGVFFMPLVVPTGWADIIASPVGGSNQIAFMSGLPGGGINPGDFTTVDFTLEVRRKSTSQVVTTPFQLLMQWQL